MRTARTNNSKEPQQKYRLGAVSIKILGDLTGFTGSQPRPQRLLWLKTYSELFSPGKKMRTETTWRSLGCRTTPLEHWSKRKPTVEPRWAKQQTKQLRPQSTKINSFLSGQIMAKKQNRQPPACYERGKQSF